MGREMWVGTMTRRGAKGLVGAAHACRSSGQPRSVLSVGPLSIEELCPERCARGEEGLFTICGALARKHDKTNRYEASTMYIKHPYTSQTPHPYDVGMVLSSCAISPIQSKEWT